MTPETLAAIGALLGAMGAFIPHISSWFKDRSQHGVERRKMDLAIKEIDFISKWISASSHFESAELDAKKSLAEKRLAALLHFNEVNILHDKNFQTTKSKPSLLRNILFYTYLGFYLFMALGASIDIETNDPSLSELLKGENLTILGVFMIPLIALYIFKKRAVSNKNV